MTDSYAEQLLHLSERIVGAVHDDGPDELLRAIDAALTAEAPPGIDPVVALVTVLAAQVDPDTTASQRLAWTGTLDDHLTPPAGGDEWLVDAVTDGVYPLDELPPGKRCVPVARLTARGMGTDAIAERVRCSQRTASRQRGKAGAP